ncbi:kelch protein [Anaeramoeba flamelloides]|uniref:Kelch protein n=1 Tax=Anaeramoeba flamelloides TaxID=1746091 RepID=A0AAV7YKZ4_9EUKA|nr:kelch protein [Anaeramoeba flamelloides]
MIKKYLNNNYQQCPKCKKLCYIETVGCGFYECECQAIFCCFCAEKHKTKLQAFSHCLTNHSLDQKIQKTKTQSFVTKNRKEISKSLKLIKININDHNVLMQKGEKVDVLVHKYCKLANENLYVRSFCYGNNYFEKGKTIGSYGIVNGSKVDLNLRKQNGIYVPNIYLRSLDLTNYNKKKKKKQKQKQKQKVKVKVKKKKKKNETKLNQKENQNGLKKINLINVKNKKGSLYTYISEHYGVNPINFKIFYNGKIVDKTLSNYSYLYRHYSQTSIWVIFSEDYKRCYEYLQFNVPFYNLYQYGENTDLQICGFNIHSQMLKLRVDLEPEYIKKTFENSNLGKDIIKKFFNWVYLKYTRREILKIRNSISQCFKLLNYDLKQLMVPFSKQLSTKWINNEEKDYKIVIKDQDDDEDDDDDEDVLNLTIEIPVHRIILQARLNLYREMFKTISETSNQVRDYSGKSADTIKILIKYLYTNSLKITADMDPEIILEELNDVVDYYQIVPSITFLKDFKKLKKQYKKD